MSTSTRAEAPRLPGFSFIDVIGAGGFSKVYLYEQRRPRRPVAVKVLDADSLSQEALDNYAEEANVMAMVSAHPYIVQVFQADVSSTGQPYFVMEYYSGPNYLQRSRQEKIGIEEVLRAGVQLASAVEVAHRAGIYHRDIKPANVLTNEYRNPGLTDFGIAAVGGLQPGVGQDGLSVPWSPPEAIDDGAIDHRSDVYSLAATLYTMLAGRAPFEILGGDNRTLAMMHRIRQGKLVTTGRDDVPNSLERVLAGAMSREMHHRPQSALAFAQQLQHVESELQLAVTTLELPDEHIPSRFDHDDIDATRAKAVRPFEHEPPPVDDRRPRGFGANGVASVEVSDGSFGTADLDDTIGRSELPAAPAILPVEQKSKWAVAVPIGLLVCLGLIVGGGWLSSRGSSAVPSISTEIVGDDTNNDHFTTRLEPSVAGPSPVSPLPIAEIIGTTPETGSNLFEWEAVEGARYQVTLEGVSDYEIIDVPQIETYADCISVRVVAPSSALSAPTTGCVPVPATTAPAGDA